MLQLRQRIIASYHLGPMDADETRTYIEHRLQTVGWHNDPSLSDEVFAEIHSYSGGIPRKINTLCDRLFLMGYLEELHAFDKSHVDTVIQDIQKEFDSPSMTNDGISMPANILARPNEATETNLEQIIKRLEKVERATQSMIDVLKRILFSSKTKNFPEEPHP